MRRVAPLWAPSRAPYPFSKLRVLGSRSNQPQDSKGIGADDSTIVGVEG